MSTYNFRWPWPPSTFSLPIVDQTIGCVFIVRKSKSLNRKITNLLIKRNSVMITIPIETDACDESSRGILHLTLKNFFKVSLNQLGLPQITGTKNYFPCWIFCYQNDTRFLWLSKLKRMRKVIAGHSIRSEKFTPEGKTVPSSCCMQCLGFPLWTYNLYLYNCKLNF